MTPQPLPRCWKGERRQLRSAGRIPAVVYGGKKDAAPLSIDGKSLFQVLKGHGTNVIMNLKVGGAGETVLLKDLQRDFVTHNIVHVDFQRVSMTEKLEVNVPLHIVGEAPGVKLSGGILEHILRELRVRCLPADIPDGINIDVSALQINQGVKVKDLVLPKGVESLIDGGSLVVNIVAPAEEEVATPAASGPLDILVSKFGVECLLPFGQRREFRLFALDCGVGIGDADVTRS